MIVSCVTYNGEEDLWDLHYNVLKDQVDQFIRIEFDQTFTGRPRIISTKTDQLYPKTQFRTHYEPLYSKYRDLALSSPNTDYGKGAEHWAREFMMKESIKDALTHLQDDDLVLIGDVDEIPQWERVRELMPSQGIPTKLKLRVYTYWLNNRSSEQFWGPIVTHYKDIKDKCLNHVRSTEHYKTHFDSGWHFTSTGGYQAVKQKLEDQYTEESYLTADVKQNLEARLAAKQDFLNRDFKYHLDESDWPSYLTTHREKYRHLLSA